ncbi:MULTISPECIES: HAMP domain-containing sensor histidine kinase [unclassified Sphingomonas]|uniref:sensor histidine kinase n=1 Tax=unclassified Sphingomonas TaxID=196159 RepID=UPI0022697ECF|nr:MULTISPECIES: HAMP domain-containing sensor histidine kinase [unclassified Sphingomonas]
MRLLPRSLSGRLLAISTLTTILALAFAAVSIAHVLERFVIRGLDQQLEAEVGMLQRAVRSDGTLDRTRIVNLPVFEDPGQGWGWQVESPRGRWTGGDAMTIRPAPPALPDRGGRRFEGRTAGMPGEGITATGEHVHARELTVSTSAGEVTVVAGGPRRLATAPLRAAMVPLLGSLAILGLVLALATTIQLRIGLRPLRALQVALGEVRAGRARHVPEDQPAELAPLAAELNALVDQNQAQLEHARRHVANLAHGLKTPLAALGIELATRGRDPDGGLRAMVADIDRRVRHHLGRARAAAPGSGYRARTVLAPAIADLTAVMRGINAERALAVTIEVAPDHAVAADPQDLDEMLGNLLDNAWRHASTAVALRAVASGSAIELTIEDDGPGLTDEAIGEALVPGRRLDERGDGHGFGLPITQELAELNGGALKLVRSPLGGLRAALTLPAA